MISFRLNANAVRHTLLLCFAGFCIYKASAFPMFVAHGMLYEFDDHRQDFLAQERRSLIHCQDQW